MTNKYLAALSTKTSPPPSSLAQIQLGKGERERERERERVRKREKVGVIRNDQYFHLLNDGDRLTRAAHVSGDLWSSETDHTGRRWG